MSALAKVLKRLFGKQAAVVSVDSIGERFRLLTLEGPALQGVSWQPGQKLQIAMASSFVARTYTPIDWDAATGRSRILGFAHGDGPGSSWLRELRAGDTVDAFGPSGSLDARRLQGPLAVFGDETSIGLAYALAHESQRAVHGYFEVSDSVSAEQAVARLGLGNATLIEKQANDAHVEKLEALLPSLGAAGSSFVLSGKAGTIQRLRRGLKQHGVSSARLIAKAYWAPGKTGLD